MEWIMVVMLACNGWGCGGGHFEYQFPDKESCYDALAHVEQGPKVLAHTDGNQYQSYCVPKNSYRTGLNNSGERK